MKIPKWLSNQNRNSKSDSKLVADEEMLTPLVACETESEKSARLEKEKRLSLNLKRDNSLAICEAQHQAGATTIDAAICATILYALDFHHPMERYLPKRDGELLRQTKLQKQLKIQNEG